MVERFLWCVLLDIAALVSIRWIIRLADALAYRRKNLLTQGVFRGKNSLAQEGARRICAL